MYLKKTFSMKKHSETYSKSRKKGVATEYDRFGEVFLHDGKDKRKVKERMDSISRVSLKTSRTVARR